jgi:valyl-tRNA synthetase
LSKNRIYKNQIDETQFSAIQTLIFVFKNILIMFAPFIPFITEEIYMALFNKSVHERNIWPRILNLEELYTNTNHYNSLILNGKFTIIALDLIRKIKSSLNVSIKKEIEELIIITNDSNKLSLTYLNDLKQTVNSKKISIMSCDAIDVDNIKNSAYKVFTDNPIFIDDMKYEIIVIINI